MGITERWGLQLVTLGALCASGCPSGADVLLGHAPLAEGGGAGDAGATAGDAGAFGDDFPSRTCPADFAGRPAVELRIETRVDGCTKPCNVQLNVMQVADDGSMWAAGAIVRPDPDIKQAAIWHYDAAGEQLGYATVEGGPRGLALDDTGQAWLWLDLYDARSSIQGSPPHLHRFDASVHELQMQVVAGTYSDMIRYPGHGVLLSGSPRPLIALDYDGEELWAVDSDTSGEGSLAVADDGRIVLGSWTSLGPPPDFSSRLTVDQWSIEGEEMPPTLTLPVRLHRPPYALPRLLFGPGADAELAVVFQSEIGMGEPVVGRHPPVKVMRLDATGSIAWSWTMEGWYELASALDPATGTILVAGPGPSIYAIAPDGTSCRRFAFDGPDLVAQLAVGPDGEVWFAGVDFLPEDIASSVGRLERPDLRW